MLIVRVRDVLRSKQQGFASIGLFKTVVVLFASKVKFEKRGPLSGREDSAPECRVLLRGDFQVPFVLSNVGTPSWTYLGLEVTRLCLEDICGGRRVRPLLRLPSLCGACSVVGLRRGVEEALQLCSEGRVLRGVAPFRGFEWHHSSFGLGYNPHPIFFLYFFFWG